MKTINKHHLVALLLALWAVLPVSAALRIPSYDKRVSRNSDFTVLVRQGGGAWQQVPVIAWQVDHVTGGRHHTETTSVAALSFSGKMDVAVVKRGSHDKSWRVRPLSYAIPSEQRGDTLFFSLDRARYLSVEVDGDLYHNLQLFADDIHIPACHNATQVAKAYKVKKKDVVFFAPGYHELSDSLGVKSGQVVYLSAGAYVKGWLSAYGAHDVKIVGTGIDQYSVSLTRFISRETGKAPEAYLWVPENCQKVKAVMLAQQNMTEEQLYKMPVFREKMASLGVVLLWVAPAFSQNWDPTTSCQTTFEEMMTAIGYQSGHLEIAEAPVIPFGHSAQATFPWNFAARNPQRTLCVISFHGDAPRTNLTGYGTRNVEWGRNRNIDGIPGLMVEGEFEWWEARVRPALAFRMMYPNSCISFLCDTGHGHFDCSEETAMYIAKFIEKSLQRRLQADGTLKPLNPKDGWLAERYLSDVPSTDGADKGKAPEKAGERCLPAPYEEYQGDEHDAFWYFDEEMARLTEARYAETRGKKQQYVGFSLNGRLVPYDDHKQGGMALTVKPDKDGVTFHLTPEFTDATHGVRSQNHGKGRLHIEVICGPVKKINETTFRIYPYECGLDNPRRSFSAWLVAVAEPDDEYKGAVQPIGLALPRK